MLHFAHEFIYCYQFKKMGLVKHCLVLKFVSSSYFLSLPMFLFHFSVDEYKNKLIGSHSFIIQRIWIYKNTVITSMTPIISQRWLENHLSVLHTVWRHDNVDVIISIVLRECIITLTVKWIVLNINKLAYLLYIDVFINTSDAKSNILNIKYQKFSSFKGLYYVNAYL